MIKVADHTRYGPIAVKYGLGYIKIDLADRILRRVTRLPYMNDQDIVRHYFPDYFDCLNVSISVSGKQLT